MVIVDVYPQFNTCGTKAYNLYPQINQCKSSDFIMAKHFKPKPNRRNKEQQQTINNNRQ